MSYYQNCKIKQSLHIYSSEKLPGAECHAESKAKALHVLYSIQLQHKQPKYKFMATLKNTKTSINKTADNPIIEKQCEIFRILMK